MKKNKKNLLSLLLVGSIIISSSIPAFANDVATPAAPNDSIVTSVGRVGRMSNYKTVTSYTGGTITSNTWLSSTYSFNQVYDYQVSATYTKTDHTNIKTEWFATVGARTTSKAATVTLKTEGGEVSATTSSSVQNVSTAKKYYENTKSQKDSSYRSSVAVQGDFSFLTITNEASVWGGKVIKKGAITSQATIYN